MTRWHYYRRSVVGLVLITLAITIGLSRTLHAQIAEERLPAAELPSASPSGVSVTPPASTLAGSGGSTDDYWQRVPPMVTAPGASEAPPALGATAAAAITTPAAESVATTAAETGRSPAGGPAATPAGDAPSAAGAGPPPALDLSTTNIGPDLSTITLDPEIKQATNPARAAALRLTEQARRELVKAKTASALQELSRAVSIDPANPFEYYYLGRVYMIRLNYAQAVTFLQRAELGFAGRADWLAETLSCEGAAEEQLGRIADAVKAYHRAAELAPGNLRAQTGLGRLASQVGGVTGLDQPPPGEPSDAPPPEMPAPAPPPVEPAAPGTQTPN